MAGEGDVVTIEVVPDDSGYLVDFSSDEPLPAMSIWPGGPPWLLPTEDVLEKAPAGEAASSDAGLAAASNGLSRDALAALEELEMEIKSVSAKGKLLDAASLNRHFVEVEALVDSQSWTPGSQAWDSLHVLRLGLFADDFYFSAFVNMANPAQVHPDLVGKKVRIKGVYSGAFDALGKITGLTLWTPDLNNVEIIGSLKDDPRFSTPVTSSESFATDDPQNVGPRFGRGSQPATGAGHHHLG